MLEVLLSLQFLLFQSEILVDASIRNDEASLSKLEDGFIKDKSINDVLVKEQENGNLENDQLYYLPTQATCSESNIQTSTSGLSSTLPPHMSIEPAPIHTSLLQSTNVFYKDHSAEGIDDKFPYQSQCVSETPAIQLESHLMLSSSDLVKESVIMSGHLEIASKTSTVDDVSYGVDPIVSKPSIAIQGTVLESHPIGDL